VKPLTSSFEVMKGLHNIRMVYIDKSSGLNDAVWVPWFSLPTVESHLRVVDEGTYMADNDIGEMILNFMLDVDIRPFAGVDLASLFPEEMFPGVTKLYTRWELMLGIPAVTLSFYLRFDEVGTIVEGKPPRP